jgi:hypothetical protein
MAKGRPENPDLDHEHRGAMTTAEVPEPIETPSPRKERGIGGGSPGGGRPGDWYDEDVPDPKRPR